jgi:hypothetical protein
MIQADPSPRSFRCWPAMMALALLVAVGFPRQAHASGCHVPDRPALAFRVFGGDLNTVDSKADHSRPAATSLFAPRPCPMESPQPGHTPLGLLLHSEAFSHRVSNIKSDPRPLFWLKLQDARLASQTEAETRERPPRATGRPRVVS